MSSDLAIQSVDRNPSLNYAKLLCYQMKTFSQTCNIAEMKKYFQYKLDRTDKSRISSPQIHSHSGDCSSELQEKNNVHFFKKRLVDKIFKRLLYNSSS